MDGLDKLNNEFVEFILHESPLSEEELQQFKNVLDVARELYSNNSWHVPYEIITKKYIVNQKLN